jgi:hypothetical protein
MSIIWDSGWKERNFKNGGALKSPILNTFPVVGVFTNNLLI